uniref:Uncharacterized protein n=1 Tax=Seriola lalandi dorsalis TaxID=1841481 RepID=A0A3B4YNT8_SERLL
MIQKLLMMETCSYTTLSSATLLYRATMTLTVFGMEWIHRVHEMFTAAVPKKAQ